MNAPTPPSPRRGSWNLWPFVPFFVIGAAVIPNTMKITNAQRHRAHQVEEQPWEASRSFDEQRAARLRFEASGIEMRVQESAQLLLLRLRGPAGFDFARLSDLEVACYRPDSADLDQQLRWRSGQTVLDLSHLQRGSWNLTLTGTLDGADIRHSVRVHSPGIAAETEPADG
ncbi:MAG: hypothetical protein EA402_10140 [Planctomycetota bacterium]|nr:MAG: hypothetical protein EA402_10140 [Planctomycetota bacterium]